MIGDLWAPNPFAKKRKSSSDKWIKKVAGISENKCFICGRTEKQAGEIQKAHIKAKSRGGSATIPLCPIHHRKFDKAKLTNAELRKLHLTRNEYLRLIPKKSKPKRNIIDVIPLPKHKVRFF